MSKHFHRDLDQIHKKVLSLSAMVEAMIDKAAVSLREGRFELCEEVVQADKQVDQQEVQIEEDCLKILALHQPVAVNLRRVATVLKVNNDLERIADLAVNIAQRGRCVGDYPEFKVPDRLDEMVGKAMQMVGRALDAFVQLDSSMARKVMIMDDEVDLLNVEIISQLLQVMQENNQLVIPGMHCFSAVRHLERIGDLATNIAEDVVYLVEGEIVRHQHARAEMGG